MPFRFFRRIRIAPGLHLNISKSGLGFSQKIGPVTLGTKRTTLNLPGTGASIYMNNTKNGDRKSTPLFDTTPVLETMSQPISTDQPVQSSNRKLINYAIAFVAMFCFVCMALAFFSSLSKTDPTPTPETKTQPIILPSETFTSDESLFPTNTAEVFLKRTPIPPPTRRPTWTPGAATNTPLPIKPIVPIIVPGSGKSGGVCSCSGDTMNCSNFGSQSSAQACFNYCVKQGRGDIHKLDRDNNGVACESN